MADITEKESAVITEAEAALYDRQIRLWGLEAQKRLRGTRFLLAGLGGLGAEVCKNVVLAGVKSITLLDHSCVSELDACSQFLVSREDVGKNRALASVANTQELNPNVRVTADESNITSKSEEYFRQFDIVCLTCCSYKTLDRVNRICHDIGVKFFAGDTYGFYGYMFADLNEHDFVEEKIHFKKDPVSDKDDEPQPKKQSFHKETSYVKRTLNFCRLNNALQKDWTQLSPKQLKYMPKVYFVVQALWKFQQEFGRNPSPDKLENDKTELLRLRDEVLDEAGIKADFVSDDFASHCAAELSPVCAVVGGVLGQEVIKAASCRDIPHNNFFFFDGLESTGMVACISDTSK
ncbi:SUMO-activating enzyme subunit 1-like [Patiria miniata]|uniref:SUMO-activating enzyme subunit 1 n=1 Tax=Patiria miniata TaxID=46514 RepID=A0A914B817_PATMI|nr:SUMO-activating enzyme subunit 1-like [Patiria miniata]